MIGEGGMLTRLLPDPGRLVHRVADHADGAGTSWRASAATPRARPLRFALRRVEPLRAELEAFAACVLDDTPEPISAYDGCRALDRRARRARLGRQLAVPSTLLDMPSPAPLAVAA